MRISSLQPLLSGLSPDAENRVTRSLERAKVGFAKDLVTPLVADRNNPIEGRLEVIGQWDDFVYTRYDWLNDLEDNRRNSIGPYSIMLPYDKRKEQVESYFHQVEVVLNQNELDYALNQVTALVPRRLNAVNLETAFWDMPRGTNLGWPFFSSDFEEYGRSSLELARDWERQGFQTLTPPCSLYWRGQPRGLEEDPKQRTVWGYSHSVIAHELRLQIPILHSLRKRLEFSAWVSQDAVDNAVTITMDEAKGDILSVDFSGFDASVPQKLIVAAFDVIRSWFSTKWWYLIDFVERVFLETGLITPDGYLEGRQGGVPSGSGLTNLIDSLVQLLVFHMCAYRMNNTLEFRLVQGDDGVFSFSKPWSLSTIQEIVESFGMKVSSDKGGVSRDHVYFLQNVHSRDYVKEGNMVGVRPLMKVLNGMLSYERFHDHWNAYDDTVRWRQQLSAAQHHPEFTKAVGWLIDHDKFGCMSLGEVVHAAGGREHVESALDMKAFPYGKPTLAQLAGGPLERERIRLCP